MLPYWYDAIVPDLRRGQTVLVAAHGNSLRALIKYLDGMSDEEVVALNVPTGIPLHYELDAKTMLPTRPGRVPRPGRGRGRDRGGRQPGQEVARPDRPAAPRPADRTIGPVLAVAVALGAVAVVLAGLALAVVARRPSPARQPAPRPRPVYSAAQPLSSLVVEALDQGVIVLDGADRVVLLNPARAGDGPGQRRPPGLPRTHRARRPGARHRARTSRGSSTCPSAGWAASRSPWPSTRCRWSWRTAGSTPSACCSPT